MAIIIDSKNKEQILRVVNDDHAIQTLPETSADQVILEDTAGNFTSDNVEGALAELANIAATGGVTGVKGDAETDYRKGNVNITKANIGLGNVENTADADKSVKHATSADSAKTATSATSADSATKATKDGGGNIISDTYATKQALQDAIAGKAKSFSYDNYQKFVEAVNAFSDTQMAVNDNVLIVTLGVPDMWVKAKNATSVTYTYTTDQAIINALNTTAGLTVGYYTFAQLETTKVDLSAYQTKTDNALETTSKTVVGAINEVKKKADANATEISNIKDGTTKAKKAETADNATNVTTNINGKAITSIFEADGVTAKNATHAGSADEATNARSADVVANRLTLSGQDSLGRETKAEYDGAVAKEVAFNAADFTGTEAANKYSVELKTVYLNEAHIETVEGTYTAVHVNSKGVVQTGGRSIAFIEANENIPADVMIGGLVFRKKA